MEKTVAFIATITLLGSLGFTGCAPTHRVSYSPYTDQTFAPTAQVDVFRTKVPDRRYTELGELCIRVGRSTQESSVLHLTEKAKEIGANAIILIGERSRGAVGAPVGQMMVAVPLRDTCAVAIRYAE